MKVKKFQAGTMPEVMKKVKKELGTDAIILNSKPIKVGGVLGLFKKSHVEVIAAIDPTAESVPNKETKTGMKADFSRQNTPNNELLKEVKSLKAMIQIQHNRTSYPAAIESIHRHLVSQEVEPKLAKEIADELQKLPAHGDISDEQWMNLAGDELQKRLTHLPFGHHSFKKQYVHLVGPTGVGKTTTVAKIAADALLNKRLKVAFITTDTYRIAAIDQLKTYAKILDIPLEVAYSLEDYIQAREKFGDYDLVLIDTAGRNFRDAHYVNELRKVVDFTEDTETYLVLSLTSKYLDMSDIYRQFADISIEKLIFTKEDETSGMGGAISMAVNHNIGVAYVTYGQNVPDDIKPASIDSLVRSVLEAAVNG
ncbi:flagellar biosynthesis protein FlhF [Halobacillus shinanisalinarum]|uniref:Flagellar biosynthesis protein FlhF n=1 Tax=Halobacillus shinanisalinarum TaxID=2932258 RepID=A0ABY4GYG2_9BACI|nr:flagellar biosynthesis protein FlhF [Halobacillus shinanisalinarum]UOQ93237.1 flagellar biosynthesis protein FlhF [Halobacillus shinanisalinarum]